jgi:cytochrome c-type biogenesis protein CcmH/NrfG
MLKDAQDKLLWSALFAVIVALPVIFFIQGSNPGTGTTSLHNRAMEQQTLLEARQLLRRQRYEPVETLLKNGSPQQALLKLEELAVTYPGDAHAFILRGEILATMGSVAGAATNLAKGVRLDGSYVDRKSPLSRREAITRLVDTQLKNASAGTSASSDMVRDLRYLQSRLAGGCE